MPAPDRPGRPKTEAGGCRAAPTWAMDGLLLLELHALARDQDRAHSYLARPGCNVLLGQAHLSRTMAKQTRILRFLRDSGHPVDWFRAPAGGPGRWATSRTRS